MKRYKSHYAENIHGSVLVWHVYFKDSWLSLDFDVEHIGKFKLDLIC